MKTRDDRAGVKCDRARQPRVLWQMYLGSGVCLVPVTRDRVLGNVVGPRHRGGRIAGQGVERRVWNSGGLGPFFNLTVSCPT